MAIPVIPCTSKTASEVRYFRNENGLSDPFIVENGAAIYGSYVNNSSEWKLILGKSYKELRVILKNISKFTRKNRSDQNSTDCISILHLKIMVFYEIVPWFSCYGF